MLSPTPQPSAPPAADPVRDVGLATFVKDVIEASQTRPVIVDFWAPWCGPCKQLVPILEKLVRAQKGAVLLAKVNIDENPQIAQQMRVQSVPTVFAFFGGQPVDAFQGALPEAQVKLWIDKLLKATGASAPEEEDLAAFFGEAEDLLAAGQAAQAKEIYDALLARAPENAQAFAGSLRCLLALDDLAQAQAILAAAPAEVAKNKLLDPVRAALDLALQTAGQKTDTKALEARLAKDENDHRARFDLALALYGAGERERAIDELLAIVRRDRKWEEDGARKQLLKLFEALGAGDPLTLAGRRKLSSILFS